MENPRKRTRRNNQNSNDNGQIIDLKAYQEKRRRAARRSNRNNHTIFALSSTKYPYAHVLGYALMVIGILLGVLGLVPAIAFHAQLTVWSLLLGTVGLVCGLALYVMRDSAAPRLLVFQCGIFVISYLCALLSFIF